MSSTGHLPAEALEEALALAGVGCWQWHMENRSLRVSANFHQLLGCPPGELPTTPEEWLQRVHADERPQLAALFDKLSTNKGPWPAQFHAATEARQRPVALVRRSPAERWRTRQ
jgi:hypothetical protein